MKNWPFPEPRRRPWWLPVLGAYSLLAVMVLTPIVVVLLALFGLLLYAIYATTGAAGIVIDVFLLLALVAIIWSSFRVGN